MPTCIGCNGELTREIQFIKNDGYGEVRTETNYFYCTNESCSRNLLLTINNSSNGTCVRCGAVREEMANRWKYKKCFVQDLTYGRHKYT